VGNVGFLLVDLQNCYIVPFVASGVLLENQEAASGVAGADEFE
jgi:hypothetical protein